MFSKKLLIFSLVILLAFSLVLVGCGGEYEEFDFEDEEMEEDPFMDDSNGGDDLNNPAPPADGGGF